ncbi:MAG TPA: hypothetical protein VH330_01660 [Candidatus Udaeobacter sp.]
MTIYEYPERIVVVIFAEHLQESISFQENRWLQSIMKPYRKDGRQLLIVGSDGGYFTEPEQCPELYQVIRNAIQRNEKLTDEQAEMIQVDKDFAYVPKRDRSSSSGWALIRFRWRMNLEFVPPSEMDEKADR